MQPHVPGPESDVGHEYDAASVSEKGKESGMAVCAVAALQKRAASRERIATLPTRARETACASGRALEGGSVNPTKKAGFYFL